jgi:hypothetical protein
VINGAYRVLQGPYCPELRGQARPGPVYRAAARAVGPTPPKAAADDRSTAVVTGVRLG